MTKLIRGMIVAAVLATALTVALPASAQSTPTLTGAASRKVHGAAGTFDLSLATDPANPTVEPRSGPSHTIVFTFNKAVTAGTATIAQGVAVAGAPTFAGSRNARPPDRCGQRTIRHRECERCRRGRRRKRGQRVCPHRIAGGRREPEPGGDAGRHGSRQRPARAVGDRGQLPARCQRQRHADPGRQGHGQHHSDREVCRRR